MSSWLSYADDSVIGFQYEEDAGRFLEAMRGRYAKFGLALRPQKTRLIEFGRYAEQRRKKQGLGRPETFDFLGFTHCCSKTRHGGFKILRLTIKKRLRATLAVIREKLKRKRHEPIEQVGAWLQQLRRRSQKDKMTWARFGRFSKKFLPYPHRLHPYPDARFAL